ncbi:MAG: glycosyltransferase family 39 protein, partial [Candidatus Binatia bacterium]
MPSNARLSVLSLCALGTILRLPNLGESLWYDEVLYSTSDWLTSLYKLWDLFLNDAPAPLYRVVLFFWIQIFPETELTVRIPSLLCGISSIVVTYWIARAYGSPRVAFLAAALLCFSPAHVWYSQEATPYAMTLFFLLMTVLAWVRLQESPSHRAWYAVYLSMFLAAVFTHYYAAVFLLPLTLLSVAVERPLRRRLLVAHAVVVSSLALALGIKYQYGEVRTGQGFLRPFTPFEWWMLFFHWFLQGNTLWTVSPYRANLHYLLGKPLLLVCQVFFLVIFLRGLLAHQGQKNWLQARELSLFVASLPVVMLLVTAVGYRQLYIERYLFWILPFFLIVLARGAMSFSHARTVIACSLAAAVLGAASYGALLYKSDQWTVYKQNPDWRSTVRYLSTQDFSPNRRAVVLAVTLADDLGYYLRRETQTPYPVMYYTPNTFKLILAVRRVEVFYLIKNRYWAGSFDKVLQQVTHEKRVV